MKKLFLLAVTLVSLVNVSAQVSQVGGLSGDLNITPKVFSYNGVVNLTSVTVEDKVTTFTIYNDEIEKIKSFSYDINTSYEIVEQRRKEVVVLENKDMKVWQENVSTWEYAKAVVGPTRASTDSFTENGMIVKDGYQLWWNEPGCYYYYEKFGMTYPTEYFYWSSEENIIYVVSCSYRTEYAGDWEEISRSKYTAGEPWYCELYDFENNGNTADLGFVLTQTLFNNDEKYEFIVPTVTNGEMYVLSSYDYDGNGEDDHRTVQYGKTSGFSIVSEDGTVLQTVTGDCPENNDYGMILKINGKLYLGVEWYRDGMDYTDFYKIDPQASSITRMGTIEGVSVSPTIAESSQDITVELGEGSNAQEIVVVNAAGQTVKRISVSAGQRQVKFNAGSLGRGMNVVNTRGAKGMGSHKIIVK